MGSLTRDDILAVCAANKQRMRTVSTPEWACNGVTSVNVRVLPAACLDRVQHILLGRRENRITDAEAMAQWCVLGVCDSEGQPLFTETDVPSLLDGPLGPLQECMLALFELNRITGATDIEQGRAEPKKARRAKSKMQCVS